MVTADMLGDAGFRTIEVRSAAEELAVLEITAVVHLLITGRGVVGDGIALAHLVHHRSATRFLLSPLIVEDDHRN
ncbi:hypothetical protein [Methylobacterium fujisawaense]|uniref:hypothetical protein n=1 Tax=Methylobacterium fujisawaense TaxID=107400 RepID=UPI002F35F663